MIKKVNFLIDSNGYDAYYGIQVIDENDAVLVNEVWNNDSKGQWYSQNIPIGSFIVGATANLMRASDITSLSLIISPDCSV